MGYVWMKDVPQVQTVGAGGIGMSPPTAVHMPEKVDEKGRYQEASGAREEIPNPGAATDGQVVKAANGLWGIGADEGNGSGGGSGSGSSGGGFLVVNLSVDPQTGDFAMDKTWQEIYDADLAVIELAGIAENNGAATKMWDIVSQVTNSNGDYVVQPSKINRSFNTDSADGYPTATDK